MTMYTMYTTYTMYAMTIDDMAMSFMLTAYMV